MDFEHTENFYSYGKVWELMIEYMEKQKRRETVISSRANQKVLYKKENVIIVYNVTPVNGNLLNIDYTRIVV